MKPLFIFIIFSSFAYAGGPNFQHQDTYVQQEFENVYSELTNIRSGNYSKTGTITNDNACAGCFGEYVSSVTAGQTPSGANATWTNLLQINLTAGDWDISGIVTFATTALSTRSLMAVSKFSGATTTDHMTGDNALEAGDPALGSGGGISTSVSAWRVSTSSAVTIYLKTFNTFSGTTPGVLGRVSARRIR